MSKRSMAMLVPTLLAAAVFLSSCGGGAAKDPVPAGGTNSGTEQPKQQEQKPTSKGPVEIEFWFAVGGSSREWIQAAAERFNAEQSEVIVKPVYQGDYYTNHQKLAQAITAKAAPAMSQIEVASIPFFASNGVLADISQFASKEDLDRFIPGLMKETQWDGKTISIPFNRSVPILYLNKTILEQEGFDPAGPKTWEELRDWAKRLYKESGGTVERWGFLTPVDQWFFEAMLYQAGGSMYSADGKKVTVNSEAGQKALQFWVDLILKDKVMEMPQGEKYNAWDVTTNSLITGKAAMIYSTTGRLNGHLKGGKENGFEITTAFLPAGPKGYATPTGGANVVILNSAPREQQEAAWKFINWMTSDKNAAEFSQKTGYVPVTKGAVTALESYYKEVPAAKTAVDFLQYAQSRPQSPSYHESQEILVKALQKAVLGEASVKDALDEAANLMTKNLQ